MGQVVFRIDLQGNRTWTYGNWGGGGWSGDKFTAPGERVNQLVGVIDPLDAVFKKHDIAYEDAMIRWNVSPKTVWDTHVFWQDIVIADKQMIGDIAVLRLSGALGNPPGIAPVSGSYSAAAQATTAFLLKVLPDHEKFTATIPDPEKMMGIFPEIIPISTGTTDKPVISTIIKSNATDSRQKDEFITVETTYLSANGIASGQSITATTFNSTTTYQLYDSTGAPVASGTNYAVALNNTIAFDAGTSKQVYDLNTGRMVAQIDANGAGFVVGSNGNDTFYSAGQLNHNTNSGILSATVSGQVTQFFGTNNFYSLTNIGATVANWNVISDSTSSGPSSLGSILIASADSIASVNYSLLGDVNTVGGNAAIINYAITDGLRPGNDNLGLNINRSSGMGLKIPTSGTTLGDYSLYGTSLNNAAASNFQLTPTDPLVLDLNGDGVKLTNYTDAPVLFDADNDGGSLEQTGWISSADGIVVHDLNGDGKINNIRETLSEYYNGVAGSAGMAGTKPFANGFAALKSLDSNGDNQFTSLDASWNNLRVWVDANHDGKTDTGELKTFANLGITAINLVSASQSGEVRDGNEVLARGSFTQNGLTREAVAANFLANPAGSTITTSGSGVIVATENTTGSAGSTGVITSFVSQNTISTVSETLSAVTLGVRHLTGGTGADTLTGDTQNNWLAGGLGADKLYGGAGDDVLLIDASDSVVDGALGWTLPRWWVRLASL